MALYEYKCGDCNLKLERLLKEAPPEIQCPACGSIAKKLFSDFGFIFGDGKERGNSGVDSLDSSIDKIVGRDSKSRWEHIKDREALKRQVKRENKEGLQLTSEGYASMDKTQVERFQNLHKINARALADTDE